MPNIYLVESITRDPKESLEEATTEELTPY